MNSNKDALSNENRVAAISWWNSLDQEKQLELFEGYGAWTPAKAPDELTGREIQNIWAVKTTEVPSTPSPSKEAEVRATPEGISPEKAANAYVKEMYGPGCYGRMVDKIKSAFIAGLSSQASAATEEGKEEGRLGCGKSTVDGSYVSGVINTEKCGYYINDTPVHPWSIGYLKQGAKSDIIKAWNDGADNWLRSPQRADSEVMYYSGEDYYNKNFTK